MADLQTTPDEADVGALLCDAEPADLARDVLRLRAALAFYADRATYNSTGGWARPIDRDIGSRAAEALGVAPNPFGGLHA